MSDLMNAIIAAKLVGGGGGSGSGLPPIETVTTELYSNNALQFDYDPEYGGEATDTVTFSIEADTDYTITWDGNTNVYPSRLVNGALPVLGNLSIMDAGADTGEPFFIMARNGGMVVDTPASDPATEHALTIALSSQSPADGDILIVDNGEWKTTPINGFGFAAIGTITINGSITIGGNSATTITSASYDSIDGLPETWDMAQGMVGIVVGENQSESGVIAENIGVVLGTKTVSCVFRNVTPGSITFSDKHIIKAVFCQYVLK